MIENRNIVIKREDKQLLFPTIERKEVGAPSNTPNKAFIMCRIVSFNQRLGTLSLRVFSDNVSDQQYQISIEENSNYLSPLSIKQVVFVNFPSSPTVQNIGSNNSDSNLKNVINEELIRKNELIKVKLEEEKQEIKKTSTVIIELPVKELKFSDGKISFEYYIVQVRRKVTFDIYHSFLKKEYDSIKNYFPKVLNVNKFSITIEFEYLDRKMLKYVCKSPQVSQIDHSLFERVEDLYINDNIINCNKEEVFTLNEIAFESSRIIGSENMQNSEWLFNKLIEKDRTKHYYHLRYLSDKNESTTFHLRLTGKPLSFIFLLPIHNGYSLIWETYLTHEATYVWKLTNQTHSQLNSNIEELVNRIKWLRRGNKMAYVREKPENFIRIEHNYWGEDLGFKKWKTQLEEFIFSN